MQHRSPSSIPRRLESIRQVVTDSDRLRSSDDLFYHAPLCIGVVLNVFPLLLRQLALGAFVERAIGLVAPDPLTEEQHALDLGTAFGEHMQVDDWTPALEHAVLIPVRLANTQHIARLRQRTNVAILVGRVGYGQQDVDDRLGGEAGYRGRADVLDSERPLTQRGLDPPGLAGEQLGPRRVVLHELDRAADYLRLAACRGLEFLLGHLLVCTRF